jgi:hypothetical protein
MEDFFDENWVGHAFGFLSFFGVIAGITYAVQKMAEAEERKAKRAQKRDEKKQAKLDKKKKREDRDD